MVDRTGSRVRYTHVFQIPGSLRAFLPSIIGKLSFAMVSLALLLLVQSSRDSFALAGLVTGVFGTANVAASPARARLIDRFGQRVTVNTLAVGYCVSLILLDVLVGTNANAVLVVTAAALAGLFPPPIGAVMRVLWAQLAPSDAHKTRAYGLDAVAEELIFTIGPLVVTAIVLLWSPSAAVIAAGALCVVGAIGVTSSPGFRAYRRPAVRPDAQRRVFGPLMQPRFLPMLLVLFGVGIVLGSTEVLALAIAARLHATDLAGVLLACFAGGSAAGGLLYGSRTWPGRLTHHLAVFGATMCLTAAILVVISSAPASAIILIAVGCMLAPAMLAGYLLADHLTAPHMRTEASAWINTAVNAGASIAIAGAGILVDRWGTTSAIAACVGSAAICLIVAAPRLLIAVPAQALDAEE